MDKSFAIITWIIYFIVTGCNAQTSTPDEYKYGSVVEPDIYKKNAEAIIDSIKGRIIRRDDPYYQSENDSLTKILVDTILYSPQKNKVAFFVITANSNDKLLDKGKKEVLHYNAHCFVGILKDNQIEKMSWVSAFTISNYKNINSASDDIRHYYFVELINRKNRQGESTFKYNFDDVRFWNGPAWERYL